MNYLKVSQRLADFTNPTTVASYDDRIAAISVLMQVLTFCLLVCFGAVAIKKVYAKLRLTDFDSLNRRIGVAKGSVARWTKNKNPLSLSREQEMTNHHPSGLVRPTTNPMISAEGLDAQLPPGWSNEKMKAGAGYFYNNETGDTSWTRPPPQ